MNRFDNKPKAVWNEVNSITKGDQKYSFYMSEKGAVKITRHTPQGETRGIILMGADVADLVAVSEELPRIQQAFQDALPQIQENKAKAKEVTKLERQVEREKLRAANNLTAALEQAKRAQEALEALTKKVG